MTSGRNDTVPLAVFSLLLGPACGFGLMWAVWSVVETDNRGGLDVGVLFLGGALAAAIVLAFGRTLRGPAASLAGWVITAFTLTALVPLLLILAWIALVADFPKLD